MTPYFSREDARIYNIIRYMSLLNLCDIRRGKDPSDRVGLFMLISHIILLLFLVLPLGALISKSLQNKDGEFMVLQTITCIFKNPHYFNHFIIVYLSLSVPL